MKYLRLKIPTDRKTRLWARLALLSLAIGLLFLSAVQVGMADGGGWPTTTPTFILFPTVTPTSTSISYPYPKTLPTQMLVALPSPTFFLPTAASETASGSSFICWPFALALLLVVILGSTVIFRRVNT